MKGRGFTVSVGISSPALDHIINDLKREGFEYGLFEVFIEDTRMVEGDQFHLRREREIEIEDTTLWPVASAIVNKTIRTTSRQGCVPSSSLNFLIHNASLL